MAPKILIVDDERNIREFLADLASVNGFESASAESGEEALGMIESGPPDALLLDLRLPGMGGMEVLRELRSRGHDFPVLIITAHGDVNEAVRALKLGAQDFIVKPFDNHRILAALRQALEARDIVLRAGMSRPSLSGKSVAGAVAGKAGMVGESPKIRNIFDLMDKVADTEATVLIRGESGTGKELVARAVHLKSGRASRPLVSINCAALPDTLLESELFGYERGAFTGADANRKGRIEAADGGTLFLDEVGDLSASAQAKLLRFLETREFSPLGGSRTVKADIRLVSATNRDIESMTSSGAFREDLFFRLNVVTITLPPLRERREDIPLLARHFADKYARKHGRDAASLDGAAEARLLEYSWPGNIRELEHAIEKLVLLGSLPLPFSRGAGAADCGGGGQAAGAGPGGFSVEAGPLREQLKKAEREIIVAALKEAGGKKVVAAEILEVSYKTLFNKIAEHGIEFKTEIE